MSLAADSPEPSPTTSTQSKRLGVGIIGVGGRGMDHVREILPIENADVVAICDSDAIMLVNAARTATKATPCMDFHTLLKNPAVDAVVIATPDHNHALITAAALRAGKHVYCEKPLTHTIAECHAIMKLAQETGLVTQLGIQIHAMDNYRRVVEIIQSGAIGPVREVHIWNNRGFRAPSREIAKPPASLNYELWLAPLPAMPYHADFHPYNWRGYWAFAEGLMGDIGCHLMDVAFWALDLKHATHIEVEGPERSDFYCAPWLIARYDFPARDDQPTVKLTWYDNPKRPDHLKQWDQVKSFEEAVLFIGDDGMLATNYGEHRLYPAEKFKDFKPPATRIAHSPGHQREWITACLKNDPAAVSAPFSYGGLLTEAALLGVAGYRAGKPLDWDWQKQTFSNDPAADALLQPHYRDGVTL